jgi:hypothetical protein
MQIFQEFDPDLGGQTQKIRGKKKKKWENKSLW